MLYFSVVIGDLFFKLKHLFVRIGRVNKKTQSGSNPFHQTLAVVSADTIFKCRRIVSNNFCSILHWTYVTTKLGMMGVRRTGWAIHFWEVHSEPFLHTDWKKPVYFFFCHNAMSYRKTSIINKERDDTF